MNTFTLFKNFTHVIGQCSEEEFILSTTNGSYAKQINALREMYEAGDMTGYSKEKSKLLAATLSATFDGGRTMKYYTGYNAIVVGDIDHVPDREMARIWQILITCPYTRAAFLSPSAHGFKFYVAVNTGVDEHLDAYNSLMQFYEDKIGFKIDRSGKDLTRLCFVSYDPNTYYNPNALVFNPRESNGQPVNAVSPSDPVLKGHNVANPVKKPRKGDKSKQPMTFIDRYIRCIAITERTYKFIEGQRNNFLFLLSVNLHAAGVNMDFALNLLLHDYNYNENEVRRCVKRAYSYDLPVKATNDHMPASRAPETEFSDPPNPDPENQPKETKKKIAGPQYTLDAVEDYIHSKIETRHNLIKGTVEWRNANTDTDFELLDDNMVNSIFCELHHLGQFIPINTLHILLNSKFNPPVNPFKEYFDNLPEWDQTTDYIGQLCETIKTHDDKFFDFCFRKWFVAYAACLVVDEVINHTVIVLVGDQGLGKTSWIKLILPHKLREYLGTTALLTDSKDTSIQLSECALIILDELESLNRKDLAWLKELMTRPGIHVRKPYERLSVNLVRHASMISSINIEEMLTDITGSRRYLCFKVSEIDYQHTVDIDMCMSQAMSLYKSGFRFWLNKDDIKELNEHNERFISKSVEQEMIEIWLRPVTRSEWDNRAKFASDRNIKLLTATQIAGELLTKIHAMVTDTAVIKIGKVLKKLGYEKIRRNTTSAYMVRMLDGETVDKNNHTIEDLTAQLAEQEANEQFIKEEEDIANANGDEYLPF